MNDKAYRGLENAESYLPSQKANLLAPQNYKKANEQDVVGRWVSKQEGWLRFPVRSSLDNHLSPTQHSRIEHILEKSSARWAESSGSPGLIIFYPQTWTRRKDQERHCEFLLYHHML